jgi:hypothetical protein
MELIENHQLFTILKVLIKEIFPFIQNNKINSFIINLNLIVIFL